MKTTDTRSAGTRAGALSVVKRRGSALLAVMWLSAALAAIAFSLAVTVRGETERTSTSVDSLRAYYLARGAVERATLEVLWSISAANPLLPRNATEITYHFASGDAHVEFIPEAAKLDVNRASPEILNRLLLAMGVEPGRAVVIAAAIDDWRRPAPQGSSFDGYYSAQTPSFLAPHASFQEIEELLQVKGVTPEIFYGTYAPAQTQTLGGARSLVRLPGLADCLSVYGPRAAVDANTASPPVMLALGIPPEAVAMIVERRRVAPFDQQHLADFLGSIGAPGALLRAGGISILTIRATARLRVANGQLSDLRRTVAAQVKYMPPGSDSALHILRWYDTAWSN